MPTREKPKKPYPDFPLFPHAAGVWAKKIKGKLHYFGPWSDPDKALANYLDQRDDLQAGRKPRSGVDGCTIRDLLNRFLTSRQSKLEAGELTELTFAEYRRSCERIADHFGRNRQLDDLRADDFTALRQSLPKTWSVKTVEGEVGRLRTIFNHAFQSEMTDKAFRYGELKKPSKKSLRVARQKRQNEDGSRMFEPAELRKIIDAAGVHLKAMTLLGANCALGATDVSSLNIKSVNLDTALLDYPRPKTGIERRARLWPETIEAIRESTSVRPTPADDSDRDAVFLTRHGARWVRSGSSGAPIDNVCMEFNKLLRRLELKRRGLSFYGLRHGFQTVAEGCGDAKAVAFIMGHVDGSTAAAYRERIDDDRLIAVTDYVHDWLFGKQ